jgi:LPXTG-motif cell wall-anchored protein
VTTRERAQAQKNIARALTAASVNRGDSSDGSLVLLVGGSLVMVLGLALGYVLRRRRQA